MKLSVRRGQALMALVVAGAAILLTGCAAVGFAASVGCEVVTAGTATDDCYELGQSISNSGN